MRGFSRRRLLAGAAVLVLIGVAAFVVVRYVENDVPAADDDGFHIESPRPGEVRRAKELVLRFESDTCFPGDKEDVAREINAPLRVEIQDRREAVVIKARFDDDYVRSISPPPDEQATCLGVGLSFTRRIVLPRPIGKRALLNGGFIHRGAMPRVLVRSLVKEHNALWSSRIKRLRYMGINREGHRLEPGESP